MEPATATPTPSDGSSPMPWLPSRALTTAAARFSREPRSIAGLRPLVTCECSFSARDFSNDPDTCEAHKPSELRLHCVFELRYRNAPCGAARQQTSNGLPSSSSCLLNTSVSHSERLGMNERSRLQKIPFSLRPIISFEFNFKQPNHRLKVLRPITSHCRQLAILTRVLMTLRLAMALQTTALLWLWRRQMQRSSDGNTQLQRIRELEEDAAKKEKARVDERKGRVAAEKELRRVMEEKLDTSKGCFVQPVGTVHSCFKVCLGTPRQGSLAPSTKAKITFQRSISPDTLVGLEAFSHVWIVFVFHQNTNGKNARAHEGLRSDSHRHTFRAKISPPMLKERVGIFCTRSPHRPNPIGITLAKIERVDMRKRTVFLSGVDLLDETPVLDIKPYIAAYDSLPDALAADWVSTPQPPIVIEWESGDLISEIHKLAQTSVHYRGAPETFVATIEEVLQVDVRSKYQTKRWTSPDYLNHQIIDNVRVQYRFALLPQPDGGSDIDTARIEISAVEKVEAPATAQPRPTQDSAH